MAAVTASTNRDSPKIDFAGVDAGAKIFVGLSGGVGFDKPAALQLTQTRIWEPRTRQLIEPRDRNWSPSFSVNGSKLESAFFTDPLDTYSSSKQRL